MWVWAEDGMEMRALEENGNVHYCHPEMTSTLGQRWKFGLGPRDDQAWTLGQRHTFGHSPEGEASLPA